MFVFEYSTGASLISKQYILHKTYESRYSRKDQVRFVEDSL